MPVLNTIDLLRFQRIYFYLFFEDLWRLIYQSKIWIIQLLILYISDFIVCYIYYS